MHHMEPTAEKWKTGKLKIKHGYAVLVCAMILLNFLLRYSVKFNLINLQ